ncbi:TonB-dependent receptor [Pseudomaricurvus sp. HS19]|uniref:TonB-dependent receptor n=1 Tax=Pseudomaricurvus sp. HS19 TaxID=2692626 RepID=UPI0013681FDB|nr:TonB-dependent receptor [Pseudomaricurvus sp. HS19]MYM62798.1 TonB-dependent receptor [Pseudomaricurvus sp. HS19]
MAQDTGGSTGFALEEVVVTARRKDESLQDVPQTVNAVGSDTFEKLNILNFEDMQSVVPGISLDSGSNGYTTGASMRGIDFRIEAQSSPSVEFYLNDAPVESNQIFTQVFDIGQVEVLRGPQGTLRGRSAPSGAITVTTRDANLSEFEGYVNATATNKGATNYQGAVNVPLVEDKLALRVAGVVDENEANGVKSMFSDQEPDVDTTGYRFTLGFAPTDNFEGSLMHQKMEVDRLIFPHHAGEARNGALANFGGGLSHHDFGAIAPEDRRSVQASPNKTDNELEATVLNLELTAVGQVFNYVGQVSKFSNTGTGPQDFINWIGTSNGETNDLSPVLGAPPGSGIIVASTVDEWYQELDLWQDQESHEIRISSEEPLGDFFDYTAGVFYQKKEGENNLFSHRFLGASPFSPFVYGPLASILDPSGTAVGAYILNVPIQTMSTTEETSVFANFTFYLTDSTELAIGGRQIWFETKEDKLLVAGNVLDDQSGKDEEFIWNVALSHRFADDFMMYSNVGTAVRQGPNATVGVNFFNGVPFQGGMDRVTGQRENERSISYEVGAKWDFMDGRGRLNAAYYYQDFEGYFYYTPGEVRYLTGSTGNEDVDTFNFTSNADTVVQGIDLDASFLIMENWTVSGVLAWMDSEVKDDIPCNQTPDNFSPTSQINFCSGGLSASTQPEWTASVTSEYSMPVTDMMDGYVRGIYSWQGENDNKHENTVIDSYGLLNLYFGVRDGEGTWDVQMFVKNVTGEDETVRYDDIEIGEGSNLSALVGGGYREVEVTPRREVGVSLRYNF